MGVNAGTANHRLLPCLSDKNGLGPQRTDHCCFSESGGLLKCAGGPEGEVPNGFVDTAADGIPAPKKVCGWPASTPAEAWFQVGVQAGAAAVRVPRTMPAGPTDQTQDYG